MTPSVYSETPDPTPGRLNALISVDSVEVHSNDEGNHPSDGIRGNEGEGKKSILRPDPSTVPGMEFSCGLEPGKGQLGFCKRGGGAAEQHQYDGVPEEGDEQNGLDCFLKAKVPTVSLLDRLTEIHGSEALSFSSALATQVAARSRSLIVMEEQTFGDDEEEEDDENKENDRNC